MARESIPPWLRSSAWSHKLHLCEEWWSVILGLLFGPCFSTLTPTSPLKEDSRLHLKAWSTAKDNGTLQSREKLEGIKSVFPRLKEMHEEPQFGQVY